ncbi:hypothetical protein M413DRAFT_18658 [Hebeloma cylindrosporum]|uniref:RNA methyltransferase n=1 Tax=Hebeloma cylindrosporum TaxID=76867 RepID=A0A0C2XXJ3_HEBCY|nr:hypothetical protein M413DRAFT_18658 [Hebeloma cylindrosporum h7]
MTSTPIHGNYHGYYTKRPFLQDERLLVLPPGLFKGARVLDVGCNEGWVTCEIAQTHGAHFVVGVDIDDALIQAAWRRRRAVWSTQAPPLDKSRDVDGPSAAEISDQAKTTSRHYFPMSCEHEFGSLPIPPASSAREKLSFPHNLSFRTADWTKTELPEDSEGYDVVIAFSISKWIHLNEGDNGLTAFFRRVYNVLKPGGSFVLEPQPWESYAKARRMDSKLKENAKYLVIRPTDFGSILKDMGFVLVQHIGSIGEGGLSLE